MPLNTPEIDIIMTILAESEHLSLSFSWNNALSNHYIDIQYIKFNTEQKLEYFGHVVNFIEH